VTNALQWNWQRRVPGSRFLNDPAASLPMQSLSNHLPAPYFPDQERSAGIFGLAEGEGGELFSSLSSGSKYWLRLF